MSASTGPRRVRIWDLLTRAFHWVLAVGVVALVIIGLVAADEIGDTGPLNRFVADATALQATAWHKGPGQWILIALAVLHLAAIWIYVRRGKTLLPAMLHGDKLLDSDAPAAADGVGMRLLALAVAAVCGAAALWVSRLGM